MDNLPQRHSEDEDIAEVRRSAYLNVTGAGKSYFISDALGRGERVVWIAKPYYLAPNSDCRASLRSCDE